MNGSEQMYAECLADGQSARRVPDESDRVSLRVELRRLARLAGVRIRTADRDGVVLVARLDAAVWTEDVKTMKSKFTPPD